jgi:hypothetical protein
MTDAHNPLTARVAVNHLWLRHFGKPLVSTVFDFGRKGAPPTHPELMDYLAVELRENRWSMKHLHRLIVTSNTYRMTSSGSGAADPENRYYWRMNPADGAQAVATSAAPGRELTDRAARRCRRETRRRGGAACTSSIRTTSTTSSCRSLMTRTCWSVIVERRALCRNRRWPLSNSRLALAAAQKIAQRVNGDSDAAFVRAAFETVLGSTPTTEELSECEKALKDLRDLATREKRPDATGRARETLVHALLNHNDFVTIR